MEITLQLTLALVGPTSHLAVCREGRGREGRKARGSRINQPGMWETGGPWEVASLESIDGTSCSQTPHLPVTLRAGVVQPQDVRG